MRLTNLKNPCLRNNLRRNNFGAKSEFIARKKSHQEFVPFIGKLIDLAHVEPLHITY